ncbi:aminodeoxychorismate synthase component I [Nitratifractor sp.]
MRWLGTWEGFERIDALGKAGEDFLFILSYDRSRIFAEPLDALPEGVYWALGNWNGGEPSAPPPPVRYRFISRPIPYPRYLRAFERVMRAIEAGETYLLNLTFPAPVECDLSPETIYRYAAAPYRLLVPGAFVCFSPEAFVTIRQNTIATYPMKGTADASLPDAAKRLLDDPKETAEHVMIVDLMRNDLNRVATATQVRRFRYLETIRAGGRELIQSSSEISARLDGEWRSRIGAILEAITPAGSITGTPKRKTMEIIAEAEGEERGFYTGVYGVVRGEELRSAVMIRFLALDGKRWRYHSGGGITAMSDPKKEYAELVGKVYLPFSF